MNHSVNVYFFFVQNLGYHKVRLQVLSFAELTAEGALKVIPRKFGQNTFFAKKFQTAACVHGITADFFAQMATKRSTLNRRQHLARSYISNLDLFFFSHSFF